MSNYFYQVGGWIRWAGGSGGWVDQVGGWNQYALYDSIPHFLESGRPWSARRSMADPHFDVSGIIELRSPVHVLFFSGGIAIFESF